MPNTSSTGGILVPSASPAPLEGDALNTQLQPVLAGISTLAGPMVRASFQSETVDVPDAGNAWMAFRYTARPADEFPFQGFGPVSGLYQMQRHEEISVLCSFYDLGTSGLADYYAALTRDGLAIAQNLEALVPFEISLAKVGDVTPAPVLVKNRWQYRVDLPFSLRRLVRRTYPVVSVTGLSGTVNLDDGELVEYLGPITSPLDVPGLALWFDGSDAAAVIQSAGVISRWLDKSPHGNNANALNPPTVQVAALNGLNTVRFTAAGSQAFTLTRPVTLPHCTTIAVVRRAGPTGANLIELLGNSTDTAVYLAEWWSDQFLYGVDGANGFFSQAAFAQQDYNLVTWISGGTPTADAIFFNGAEITGRGQGDNPNLSRMVFDQIGLGDGGTFMNGELAELLVFDSALNSGVRRAVEGIVKAKWRTP